MDRLQRLFAFVYGDGSLTRTGNAKNYRMTFHHGPAQIGYMKWKLHELENLGFKVWYSESRESRYDKKESKYDGRTYFGCHGQTQGDRLFTAARRIAYPKGEKEYNQRWLNPTIFDEYAMALWWMDDGSLSWSKGSATIAGQLHVCGTYEECLLVKTVFEIGLQEEVAIHRRRQLFHLYFPSRAFRVLIAKCLKYFHQEMLYKCAVLMGEDGKPIIPSSAEHLKWQLQGCPNKMKI